MKYIKLLMALLALCILAMPAFSMPDDGNAAQDDNTQVADHSPAMGPAPQDNLPKPCDCQAPMGQDDKIMPCHKHIKSMMGERGPADLQCAGPKMDMMGPEGMQGPEPCGPKMDDNPCPCAKDKPEHIKPLMGEKGPEGMQGPEPMMAEVGPDGKKGPEPMEPILGDNPCDKKGPKPIKSMMGGIERGPMNAKTIIVNVNL